MWSGATSATRSTKLTGRLACNGRSLWSGSDNAGAGVAPCHWHPMPSVFRFEQEGWQGGRRGSALRSFQSDTRPCPDTGFPVAEERGGNGASVPEEGPTDEPESRDNRGGHLVDSVANAVQTQSLRWLGS